MHHWFQLSGCEDIGFWDTLHLDNNKYLLFGICDGHMGRKASMAVPKILPNLLEKIMVAKDNITRNKVHLLHRRGLENILPSTFELVDEDLNIDEGSTATILFIEQNKSGNVNFQVANVGDTQAIIIDLITY